jgi:hypothetical protein
MPEEPVDLIATLCLTPLSERRVSEAAAFISHHTDWTEVLSQAAQWDVEAVVLFNLSKVLGQYIAEPYQTQVASREQEIRATNISRALMSVKLASFLEGEGIRVIVIKGAAVGLSAYGDPSLRASSDIDLLVGREDLSRARRLLESHGYTCAYDVSIEHSLIGGGHALELTDKRLRVELHWRLLETHLRWNPDLVDIWKSSRRVVCVGGEICILPPHVEFLFLCAHGVKHQWLSAKWVCDIAQLANRLSDDDVRNVLALAERTRAKRILQVALGLARELLGFFDDRFLQDYFAVSASVGDLVATAKDYLLAFGGDRRSSRHSEIDPRLNAMISWLAARESWADKAAIVTRFAFVPSGNEKLPAPIAWVFRPFKLMAVGTKFIARARLA